MNLTVSVSEAGFTIAASGAVLHQGFSIDAAGNIVDGAGGIPSIPKKGADYDYEGLKKSMFDLKKSPQGSSETQVTINANPGIIYEVIVNVLDNCRGKAILRDDPANPGKKIRAVRRLRRRPALRGYQLMAEEAKEDIPDRVAKKSCSASATRSKKKPSSTRWRT